MRAALFLAEPLRRPCLWATFAVSIALLLGPVSSRAARPGPARGQGSGGGSRLVVQRRMLTELAPVFGTVEGARTLPARARIAGTVATLDGKDGDHVIAGQELAIVADSTLLAHKATLDAEITGNRAQLAEARLEFTRAQRLVGQGAVSRATFDQARSGLRVAESTLSARLAKRETIEKQIDQGAVRAPHAGLVLHVPVAKGSVLMPGDIVAEIAEAPFRVRLAIPERYIRFVHQNALIRIDGNELGVARTLFGSIDEIKPGIVDGRVIAYATVPKLPARFIGVRVQAWLPAQRHPAIVIPRFYILSLSGADYAQVAQKDGQKPARIIDVPIQRGATRPSPAMPDGIEILSGLEPGDVLVRP